MDPERWRQIEALYHAVLIQPEENRSQFLDQACRGDEQLRNIVDSLLARIDDKDPLMETPATELAAVQLTSDGSTIAIEGRQLGAYRIGSLLGSGGMGEVYRARDLRLGRDVAIKLLPRSMDRDPGLVQRFEREAQILAALNHPHIAAIYELEEADGIRGLVLELVEGQTLAERIADDPLPLVEVMTFSCQIAEALEAAHAKGIIHRDLKPRNIKVTPDGVVKVLDFGLAKVWSQDAGPLGSTAPMTTMANAQEGRVVGTAAYMSPEQALGQTLDTRTDIWAFGCVVFEMLTGKPAFPGSSVLETISRVLERDPDWTLLPQNTPLAMLDLLRKCLQKQIGLRPSDISHARLEIERCIDTWTHDGHQGRQKRRRPISASAAISLQRLRWVLGTLAVAILVGTALAYGPAIRWMSFAGRSIATNGIPFAERDWILIADLDNQTGEGIFDKSLNTALTVSIGQSSYLNILPPTRVQASLRKMRRPISQAIDAGTAREVALRENVRLVLAPTLANVGGRYLFSASLLDPSSGTAVTTLSAQAQSAQTVLKAVDELASGIRRHLGEASAALDKQSKPLHSVTTPSLEALKLYSAAVDKFTTALDSAAARALFQNALTIDPSFTSARASLGMLEWEFFDQTAGKQLLAEAVQHASDLTESEKYSVLAFHATIVEDNPQKAVEYWKALLALYPDRAKAHNDLGRVYQQMWRLDEAIPEYRAAIRLDPYSMPSYFNLNAMYLFDFGDVASAITLCKQQISINDGNARAYDQLGWALVGVSDFDGARLAFETALAINPRLKLARFRLGYTLRKQRRYHEAIETFLKIGEVDPKDIDMFYSAGVASELSLDHSKALHYYNRFRFAVERKIRSGSADAGDYFDHAIVLSRLRLFDRSWAEAQIALRMPRPSRSVFRSPAWNFPPSSQSSPMTTDGPDSYFDLARLLNVMGKTAEAIDALKTAVDKGFRNYILMKVHNDLGTLAAEPAFEMLLGNGLKTAVSMNPQR